MPRNSSGVYTLPQPSFVAGTVISSAAMNSNLNDIASALTGSLPVNGSTGMTGQLKAADGNFASPSITFSTDVTTGFYHGTDLIGVAIAGVSVGSFGPTGWGGNIGGFGAIQIGMILDFAGSTAPGGYQLCFGQAISRTTYVNLFNVIGTTYGNGDGATTFNVPDLRGITVAGLNNMGGTASSNLNSTYFLANPNVLGTTGGGQSVTVLTANLPAYTPAGAVAIAATFPVQGFAQTGSSVGFTAASQGSNNGGLGSVGVTITSETFTGTPQGGTNTPHSLMQPSIVMNKLIYAGV